MEESGKKKFLKNTFIVLLSNIISIASGILIGFIVPKMMGVAEYGYYKTFALYSSYIGVLHFGFIDGIYLKFAGKKYEDLEKTSFRTYTRFLFLMEGLISLAVSASSFLFAGTAYFFVVLFVGLNIMATNVITYFEFISQITMRFKRTSARNIIKCALNIGSVLVLYLLYKYNSFVVYNYIYVGVVLLINYILAIWYFLSYKDISFGPSKGLLEIKGDIAYFFKTGIPLLLSNFIAQLVFVVDQQFVNIFFKNEVYALYAFAYSMIGLVTVATNAISVVLYPTLKSSDEKSIIDNYSKYNTFLLLFVALCVVAYFPLCFVVQAFLPKYLGSLPTLYIILPGLVLSSSISVLKYNCYKIFGKIGNYFIKSLIVLILAILGDWFAFAVFGTTESISIISILVLFIWYILVEGHLVRVYRVSWVRNFLFIVLMMMGFYAISLLFNLGISLLLYLAYYAVVSLLLFNKEIVGLIRSRGSFRRARRV